MLQFSDRTRCLTQHPGNCVLCHLQLLNLTTPTSNAGSLLD